MSLYTTIFFEPTAVIRRTLCGLEPADMNSGPHAEVGVVEPEVGDVFVLRVNMPGTPRGDGRRARTQHEIRDRDVVRGQIEDDVHVRLVKPEIQAGAIKVEKRAELTSADEIPQFVHCCVVLEGVAGHEHDAGRVSRVHQGPRVLRRGRHGLFDKHVLAGGDGLQAQRRVGGRRGGDDDRIDVRQRLFDIRVNGDAVVSLVIGVTDTENRWSMPATGATPVVDRSTRTCLEPQ